MWFCLGSAQGSMDIRSYDFSGRFQNHMQHCIGRVLRTCRSRASEPLNQLHFLVRLCHHHIPSDRRRDARAQNITLIPRLDVQSYQSPCRILTCSPQRRHSVSWGLPSVHYQLGLNTRRVSSCWSLLLKILRSNCEVVCLKRSHQG